MSGGTVGPHQIQYRFEAEYIAAHKLSLLPTNLPRAHYLRLSTVGEKLGRKRTRRADTNLPAKVHIIHSTRNVPANATYSESFNFFHLFTVLQSPLPRMAIPSLFDYSQITTLFKLQACRGLSCSGPANNVCVAFGTSHPPIRIRFGQIRSYSYERTQISYLFKL